MNECYGNPPKFSRGHMTRREDPGWGDAQRPSAATKTRCTSPTRRRRCRRSTRRSGSRWKTTRFENAREDDMKISVFTGPYFSDAAIPTMYGVRIPLAFWKIIAFIHDETGSCAPPDTKCRRSNPCSRRKSSSSARSSRRSSISPRRYRSRSIERRSRPQVRQSCRDRSAGGRGRSGW